MRCIKECILLHQRLDGGFQLGDPTAGMQTFAWYECSLSRATIALRKRRLTNYDVDRGITTEFSIFDGPVGIFDSLLHV